MSNNSFKVKNGITLTPVDLATQLNPQAGDLACDINDSNKIKRYDANLLSWTEVGSGGVGNIDALLTQNFDNAALSQFIQTGLAFVTSNTLNGSQTARLIHQSGSPQSFKQVISVDRKYRSQLMQLSLLLQSSAPQGDVTLNIFDETNAANIVASEQLTTGAQAISGLATTNLSPTISGFTNAVINTLRVGERVTGSGIPTGSIINSINTTALTVTISQNATATASGLTLNFSELPARQVVSFVIPASCASLSYTVTALAEAGLPETYVDDVVIELAETALLETSVEVPVVTAWQGYTPTFQGFGSPTNVEFEWRQVGENVEIRGKFASGTPTAVEARVSLPNGFTSAGTGAIPSIQIAGRYASTANITASPNGSGNILIEPSVTYVTFSGESTGNISISKQTGSAIAGNTMSLYASVPCAGLSATSTKTIPLTQSGLIQEADSLIRLQTFSSYGSTATKIPRFTSLDQTLGDSVTYIDSATDGASFVIQESGTYTINFSFSANTSHALAITKNPTAGQKTTNASSLTGSAILDLAAGIAGNTSGKVSWTGYLLAGDIIYPHTDGVASSGGNQSRAFFSIAKENALKQVAVNSDSKITIPTSELRFEGASSRGSTATSIVRFDTQTNIRGDAFEVNPLGDPAVLGTHIRIRKAGRLSVNASVYAVNGTYVYLSKNQSVLTTTPTLNSEVVAASGAVAAGQPYAHVSSTFDVVVGDIIRVSSSAAISSAGNATFLLNLQEQQVAVSVTNTLPQFSESDSSVRVDTANGYGSTATKIRRFSNVRENVGSDINYVDSATEGSSFIARTSGIYEISYTENTSGTVSYFAISKNSSQLTTNPDGISEADRLALGIVSTAGYPVTISSQVYLVAGDVIRAHASGQVAGTNNFVAFRISKVGKPNVTGVDVTPFVNVPQPEKQTSRLFQEVTFGNTTITGNLQSSNGSGIFSYNPTTGNYTVLKTGVFTVTATFRTATNASVQAVILVDGFGRAIATSTSIAGVWTSASFSDTLTAGQVFSITNASGSNTNFQIITVSAEALSDQILTQPETFSTDTAALTYAGSGTYTLSTLANAPVGTYITFTYAANTNTRTQTTTRPTQTDADMNANGMLLYTRAYNAASTAAQPAAIAIQIGKGLKGKSLDLYKSAGKVGGGNTDYVVIGSFVEFGLTYRDYNESTGILTLDAGLNNNTTTTNRSFQYSDLTNQTSGYLVINASKNPALTGIGLNRVAASAQNTSGQTVLNSLTTITYDSNKYFDTHNALNTATGVFTAPESGYYNVQGHILFSGAAYTVGQNIYLNLVANGITYRLGELMAGGASTFFLGAGGSKVVYLAAGQTASLQAVNERGSTALLNQSGFNTITISKVSI